MSAILPYSARGAQSSNNEGTTTMRWTEPRVEPLKMDAEIGSYQEDTDPARETPFARRTFRRTVARLARRGALYCAAPAGVAMAIGCSSAAPSASGSNVGGQ